MNAAWKILMTLAALSLAIAHVVLPEFEVDVILLILLVLAALPWFARFIKAFEIPGVVKIDLAEAKAATEKVTTHVLAGTASLRTKGHPATVQGTPARRDTLDYLGDVFPADPNLALVGFRIEIEKRVNELAELTGVESGRGLQRTIRGLVDTNILSGSAAAGLIELVALGNQAAHGARVTREAAEWVLGVGPSILTQLDEQISNTKDA